MAKHPTGNNRLRILSSTPFLSSGFLVQAVLRHTADLLYLVRYLRWLAESGSIIVVVWILPR